MRCIGIDIGSSSIKGGILDLAAGRVERTARVPFPEPVAGLPPGFHEVPAEAIVEGTRRVLSSLLAAAPDARELRVQLPADRRQAPAGYYLLFAIDTAGVPSVAKLLRLHRIARPD